MMHNNLMGGELVFGVNDFLYLMLLLAIIFAIVGISIQIMKLLSKATDTMEEFRQTNKRVNTFLDKVVSDYDYISGTLKIVADSVNTAHINIVRPMLSMSKFLGAFENIISKKFWKKKSKKESSFTPEE